MTFFIAIFASLVCMITCFSEDNNLNPKHPGPCPSVIPPPGYDDSKILGKWIATNTTDYNLKFTFDCMSEVIEKSEKGLFIDMNLSNTTGGIGVNFNFTIRSDEQIPGTFFSSYEMDGNTVPTFSTAIIKDDFYFLWNCCSYGKEHREVAYILARPNKTLPDDAVENFYQFLKSHNSDIKQDDFYPLLSDKCDV